MVMGISFPRFLREDHLLSFRLNVKPPPNGDLFVKRGESYRAAAFLLGEHHCRPLPPDPRITRAMSLSRTLFVGILALGAVTSAGACKRDEKAKTIGASSSSASGESAPAPGRLNVLASAIAMSMAAPAGAVVRSPVGARAPRH